VQFDFNMPERFNLCYTGEDGKEHRPYMVHRALLGSLERFFGILIEHYAGAFPVWLAPEQVRILPITENQVAVAERALAALHGAGLRATLDRKSEKIGAKIRRAQVEKVPYMAVIGQREAESGTVALRSRSGGDQGAIGLGELVARLAKENAAEPA
jgi:threonyl-tRNA synthetase